ncbi:hypothetical protein [Flavobacterium reichenbachii]|uniref:Uncharacterized protein n=1 Tax=Flavobacterium reichenbachii TaxID=362418 RepID=A0A085ZK94_9FLAO|nr:hypothetical protein [Flavobacterium reichenbachii]KFF04858.1 hypothetical protein IW19_04630 [Flavobacterium reichenbachii]OXB12155.1 hypothetical protein B0A68_19535 [Flavobacterium reichenbachii]
MKLIFSETQNNVINKIWVFGTILFSISMLLYCIEVFTPNTFIFTQLWRILSWFFNTFILAWYFYKNNKIRTGITLQLLSIPYFFKNSISSFLDYNLTSYLYDFTWYESSYIYKIINFIGFLIPFLYFVKHYFALENFDTSKKTKWIFPVLISIVLLNVIDVELENTFGNFTFLNFSEPYMQDIFITTIELINTFKILFALIGFFYITNRFGGIKSIRKPIDEQFIDTKFFKWGFIISYFILILTILNLAQSILSISLFSSEFNLAEVSKLVSSYFLLLYSGRFLGSLIQFRGYSLKRYFGVINAFTLIPIINIFPFLVLLLTKKAENVTQYFDNLKKNKTIHLGIYCLLLTLFLVYDYFTNEVKTITDLIKIPVFILAIFLVAHYKIMTKIVPFAVVLFLYFEDIKRFFDFTEGYLAFFKDKIFSFLWLSSFGVFILYYVFYYVLHKSFYAAYSNTQNQENLTADTDKFNQQ